MHHDHCLAECITHRRHPPFRPTSINHPLTCRHNPFCHPQPDPVTRFQIPISFRPEGPTPTSLQPARHASTTLPRLPSLGHFSYLSCPRPLAMKIATASLLSTSLFLSQLATAVSLQCDNVQLDKKKFDLSKLSGRHSVWVHDASRPPAEYNTTWTINLCQPLEKLDGIPSRNQCPAGTRGVLQLPWSLC